MKLSIPLSLALMCIGGSQVLAGALPTAAGEELCRTDHLVGYGIVVGLDKTGDSFQGAPYTRQSLRAQFERARISGVDPAVYERRVAAAMVTARVKICAIGGRLQPAAEPVDLGVSAFGDSTSLQGGALLMTPLLGADGRIHAVGQGVLVPCTDPSVLSDRQHVCVPSGGLLAR